MKISVPDASCMNAVEVPLLSISQGSQEDEDQGRDHQSLFTKTKLFAALGILILLIQGGCCRRRNTNQDEDWKMMTTSATNSKGKYGVDMSWPIHGPIQYDNNPWFQERHQLYMQQLDGCRAHYGKISKAAARTCDVYEYDRILMNRRQPQSMQNYTKVGFQKVQAPQRVQELVQDFWQQNHYEQHKIFEQWPEGNPYLNHWTSPSYMISVDDTGLRGSGYNLKRQIWAAAQSTISRWTGQDITPVSMYGIRVYTNGSLLIPHVDRLPLVASAMINVAQDVDEDWPIEIYDHSGRAHNVTLHPGDMLLFESHSVIHGRPFPMKGRYYAMLFIHFEPTGKVLLQENNNVDEQYRQAVNDGVGGQSSSEQSQLLPPYIKRFSPEEEHWQKKHPEGWKNSGFQIYPAAGHNDEEAQEEKTKDTTSKTTKQTAKQQQSKYSTSKEHKAAREGDLTFWKNAMEQTQNSVKKDDILSTMVNKRDAYGWMPIHESAANGQNDMTKWLLRNGADINARTNGGRGGTPLFLAQQKLGSNHPIVTLLQDRGALSIPPDGGTRDEL